MSLAELTTPRLGTFVRYAGRIIAPAARRHLSLQEEALLEAAQRQTRCDHFDDETFLEPLRRLLEALAGEARLNFLGTVAARGNLVRLLSNRLLLERDRASCPEIAEQKVSAPIFITGLPRSGSTFLHGLLAQDPQHRAPRTWEAMYPSPPPDPATCDTDRRIRHVTGQIQWIYRLAPEFRRIHPMGARLPQECVMLMSHSFLSREFSTMFYVPTYDAWLERQDLRPAYAIHRRILQQLQLRFAGERWLLKAPCHVWSLPALFETYPDAHVIMTHRDPLDVIASLASLHTVLRRLFSDAVDPLAVGPEVSEALATEVGRALEARETRSVPEDRLCDVAYADLLRDPIGVVRSIYARFDLSLSADAESRMRRYLTESPKEKHGRHEYSLAEFGMSASVERARFGAYCVRHGFTGEPATPARRRANPSGTPLPARSQAL